MLSLIKSYQKKNRFWIIKIIEKKIGIISWTCYLDVDSTSSYRIILYLCLIEILFYIYKKSKYYYKI